MRIAKAAVAKQSDPLVDCPVLSGTANAQYDDARRAARAFSIAAGEFLDGKSPEEKVAWLKVAVSSSRTIFQPWCLEIVYVVAALGTARFGELHDLIGLSTRTLADKLKALKEAGFLERRVFDEQPVRIEYALTKHGRATAAMASPLFAHLNMQALKEAGRV